MKPPFAFASYENAAEAIGVLRSTYFDVTLNPAYLTLLSEDITLVKIRAK